MRANIAIYSNGELRYSHYCHIFDILVGIILVFFKVPPPLQNSSEVSIRILGTPQWVLKYTNVGKMQFSTKIATYLGNGTRQACGYCGH